MGKNAGLFQCSVGSVALLPEELSCADKGGWVFKLPSDNVGPLVEQEGQITMAVDPLRKTRVHNGLRSGSDRNRFGKIGLTTFGDPCNFGGETFNVVFFFVQCGFSDEHWEVAVLHTNFFD
jgi:hypothetical protein